MSNNRTGPGQYVQEVIFLLTFSFDQANHLRLPDSLCLKKRTFETIIMVVQQVKQLKKTKILFHKL